MRRGERHEIALARLLFYYHRTAGLQEVHTSLYAKRFAEERRFEHHVLLVITLHLRGKVLSYQPTDILLLPSGLVMEVGGNVDGQHSHGVLREKVLYALGV